MCVADARRRIAPRSLSVPVGGRTARQRPCGNEQHDENTDRDGPANLAVGRCPCGSPASSSRSRVEGRCTAIDQCRNFATAL